MNILKKPKTKRLFGIMLSLVMMLTMMPMATCTAFAEKPAINNVVIDGNKSFYTGKEYYKNGDNPSNFTGSESDYNAHYNPDTGVLTLKEYTGGRIAVGGAIQADLTIELIGENNVTGSIENNLNGGGDITITGNGSLTVDKTGSDNFGMCGIEAGNVATATTGNVTIKGNAKVTINTTNNYAGAGKAYGIYAKQSITISDRASVDITCKTPSGTSFSDTCYGMFVPSATSGGKVTINTSGAITINVKDAGTNAYSYGISAPSYDLTTVDHMIAEWKGTAENAFYGAAPTFDSTNYAVNIDTTNCYASYRHGTPYTVNVTNGDLTGPGVKYSNWKDAYYFLAGDEITLTAPNRQVSNTDTTNIPFVKWVSDDVTISDATTQNGATFIMPDKNVAVTAKYNAFIIPPVFTRDSQYDNKGTVSVGLISDSYSQIPNIRATSDLTGTSYGNYNSTSKVFTVYKNYCPAGEYVVAVTYNGTTYYSEPFTVNYDVPTATVLNVTVAGQKGASIEDKEVKITLNNDEFKSINNGDDVSSWFTNLPAGLTAKVKYIEQDIETSRKQGVTITISGAPTVTSNAVMAITIPADCLVTSTSGLTVTTNNGAKYNINVLEYSFSITPGEGITLGDNSSQTVEAGRPITNVICTAKDGYYFPTDYSSKTTGSYGISITRDSYTQITVSGTPTTNVGVGLAAATAKAKETTPTASFAANGESSGTLSNVENSMKYSLDGGLTWIDITGTTVNIGSGVTAESDIKVKKPATNTDTKLDSDIQTIDITKAAQPTGVTAVDCTTNSNDDGKLTNVTSAMEYRKVDETSSSGWTTCTDTKVTGLTNGTYHVRIKANGNALASEPVLVVIAAYNAVKHSVTVTVNNSSFGGASADKSTNVAEGEAVKLTATPATGYVFDKWGDITPSTLTISSDGTFTMPNDNVSVKAYFKPADLTGTVTITGTEKFGQTLTAAVSGSNSTGTLTYEWYRDGAKIATGNSHTIAAEDIGKALTCKVTSNVQTGTIEKATSTIQKADGPTAPISFTLTFTLNTDGTTFTATIPEISDAEYSFDGTTWSNTRTKADCQPNTSYTGYARIKETTTHNAGASISDTKTAPKLQVSTPIFTPNGAAGFSGTQAVTISCGTAEATIYYTTDGTEPTTSGTVYSTTLNLTATTTIKAIAVKDDMENSAVATATFTKSSGGSSGGGGVIPVIPVETPAEKFVKDNLSANGGVIKTVDKNNYEQILAAADKYDKLSTSDKAAVDKLLKEKAGMDMATFTAEASKVKASIAEPSSNTDKVKSLVKGLSIKASSAKLKSKSIRVTLSGSTSSLAEIKKLGYTVKYKFYRSTKKTSSYKAMLTKNEAKYVNSTGKKGTMYYYKARVMVYDKAGKLVAQSELKQCKYANRKWTK